MGNTLSDVSRAYLVDQNLSKSVPNARVGSCDYCGRHVAAFDGSGRYAEWIRKRLYQSITDERKLAAI